MHLLAGRAFHRANEAEEAEAVIHRFFSLLCRLGFGRSLCDGDFDHGADLADWTSQVVYIVLNDPCPSIILTLQIRTHAQYIAIQVVEWLSLSRLLQIATIIQWLRHFRTSKRINSTALTFFFLTTAWIFYVHVSACIFFLIAEYESYVSPQDQNWVNQNSVGMQTGEDLFALNSGRKYLIAFYLIALTLIGQPPDLYTPAETLYLLLIAVSGFIVLMSAVLGVFVSTVGTYLARRLELDRALDVIKGNWTG